MGRPSSTEPTKVFIGPVGSGPDEWLEVGYLVSPDVLVDTCPNCERCTWNPGPDCGRREHPHCEKCGHCIGRHTP